MSSFQEHYAELHDDVLIDLALTRELRPEAAQALQAELRKRGIHDLGAQAWALAEDQAAQETDRLERIRRKERAVGIGTKSGVAIALVLCALGIYRLVFPSSESARWWEGGTLIVLSTAVFLFILATAWIKKLWIRHVLHRAPPR